MSIPRDQVLNITPQLLDRQDAGLFERFVRLAEKYQYRDLERAVADAIRAWVEAHEQSDTGRPPPGADATLQASPPVLDTDDEEGR